MANFVEVRVSEHDQVITREMVYSSPAASVGFTAAAKLHQLIGLSEAMAGDASFVRQARRKLL